MVQFKNSLTEEDYIQYNLYHMSNAKGTKRLLISIRFLFPVMFLLFGLLTGRDLDIVFWVMFAAGSLGTFLMIPKWVDKSIRKRLSNLLAGGSNGELFDEKDYNFDHEGIKVNGKNSSNYYAWESVTDFKENDLFFFIHVSAIQALIVRKTNLEGQVDLDEFRRFIQDNLKKDGVVA